MSNDDENAKDPRWKIPMDLPSVKPEAYDATIDSGRGSAKSHESQDNPAKEEQKKRGQLPKHDEPIGGA